MRALVLPLLAIAALGAGPGPRTLPRGGEHFQLGMSRAQLDSVVAARGVKVISSGTSSLTCESNDARIEFERYSFHLPGHSESFLWNVSIGYRLTASREDFRVVRDSLRQWLGEPQAEAGDHGPLDLYGNPQAAARSAHVTWADAMTAVQLGARWTEAPDRSAERMQVVWTDRRIQRAVEAARRRDRGGSQ